MKIQQYEDAEVWQLARQFAIDIYKSTREGEFQRDYSFRDQIRRSAVSIMANIAEGFERRTNNELKQFLYFAKGSAGEVRSHLYLAGDIGYLGKEKCNCLLENVRTISRSLSGFIKYLNNKE